MTLTPDDIAFIEENSSAAMITLAADGTAKAVRVTVAIIGGKLWSTGTKNRGRTARLLRDPRSTLFVFDADQFYRSLETTVTIIDGPEGINANVRWFRKVRGQPEGPIEFFNGMAYEEEAFRAALIEDGRIMYEFDVLRSAGIDRAFKPGTTVTSAD